MKRIYVVIAGMCLSFAANAQVGVGLMGGLNMSNQRDQYRGETVSNQLKAGYFGGVVADIPLSRHLALQPALIYSLKGGEQTRTMTYTASDGMHTVDIKSKNSLHYIEMPVNLVYKIPAGRGHFFVGAGGYAATLVSAYSDVRFKNSVNGGSENVESDSRTHLKVGDNASSDLQRFDFGVTGILGYKMSNGLFVRGGVDAGVGDIIRNDNVSSYQSSLPATVNNMDATSKNITYNIGIGYMLR